MELTELNRTLLLSCIQLSCRLGQTENSFSLRFSLAIFSRDYRTIDVSGAKFQPVLHAQGLSPQPFQRFSKPCDRKVRIPVEVISIHECAERPRDVATPVISIQFPSKSKSCTAFVHGRAEVSNQLSLLGGSTTSLDVACR